MSFEIGQRVVFRSLQWEIADTSTEISVELFGRSEENRGRRLLLYLFERDEAARLIEAG